MSERLFTDYGTTPRLEDILLLVNQRYSELTAAASSNPTLLVCKDGTAGKTVSSAKNGLSRKEIERLCNAARFMQKTGVPIHWAVLGDDIFDIAPADARAVFDRFQAHLNNAQKRAGIPAYWLSVFEATGGLHANFVFVGDEKLARRLCCSFPAFMRSGYGEGKAVQPVANAVRLVSQYLSKERTVQANYALCWPAKTRMRGSHRLPGGGDRVRLSEALRIDAIAAGAVEPWKATRARRQKGA